jgi:hypothetical protein
LFIYFSTCSSVFFFYFEKFWIWWKNRILSCFSKAQFSRLKVVQLRN